MAEDIILDDLTFDAIQDVADHSRGRPQTRIRLSCSTQTQNTDPPAAWQHEFEIAPGVLVLSGHGDGMHMLLGEKALCGAAADAKNQPGGCAQGQRCRKARAVQDVVYAAELRGDVAFLLSCNSLNVAGQLGSPDVSIARALINAGFNHVIGSARQVAFEESHVRLVQHLWNEDTPLADVVAALNSLEGVENGYVILALDEDPTAITEPTELPAPERGHETPPIPSALPHSEYAEVEYTFSTILAAKRVAAIHAKPLEEVLTRQLKLIDAMRGILVRQHMSGTGAFQDVATRIRIALNGGWDDAVSAGLLGGVGSSFGDLLQGALLQGNAPNPQSSESTRQTCSACGGRVRLNRAALVSGHGIETEWCTGCGVRRVSTAGREIEPTLNFPRTVRAGESVTALASGLSENTLLHLQLRDKSRNAPVIETRDVVNDLEYSRSFALPIDAGPDIGSIRAVVFQGSRVTYLRRVFIVERGGSSDH
ncbi:MULTISPECIES: hypothetical protein [unclassified Microbacterium]|uniref:hypothetical protein n=1 Tax=unclassified Microbacterium TaxID=2609290 RepID=UPI001604DC05|nr:MULTISPECIES: hypothetical protein [unclassified Microbacterium]QNA91334.1 hypothetical protein G4G29_00755 [Microbacterium sp. Se63.02b]QYM64493.1 hypothetical protein K1X59_00765 [Microbacterium sp. Se5.02b]